MMTSLLTDHPADVSPAQGTDWGAVARELGPLFAARAPAHDANDSFPLENYRELKAHRVFSAGVPAELGGGGATHRELCATLRELAHHCGATALALSMHTHLVQTLVWLWRRGAPVAPLLERVAAGELVLVTTGASDWLDSGGTAEPVVGGFRVTAHKRFASGSPAGDLLLTSAVLAAPDGGETVLHFAVPVRASGVTVLEDWRTMSMRASGSNGVRLEGVFVPEEAVSSRSPRGAWDPVLDAVSAIALPLVQAVYLGVAEAARDLTLRHVAAKAGDASVWYLVGEMENALVTAQLAVQGLIDLCDDLRFVPGVATTNAGFVRKTIAARAVLETAEKALEATGGAGLYRNAGLERLVRDVHAAQFHPLPAKRQHRFTGRVALGLDPLG